MTTIKNFFFDDYKYTTLITEHVILKKRKSKKSITELVKTTLVLINKLLLKLTELVKFALPTIMVQK